MPSKTYSEEFKRDAVALYESSPDASIQTIATELGVNGQAHRSGVSAFR